MKLEISSHERSKKVIMTDGARVLKRLRIECGLSLREVGKRVGKNHATIAHIEGGRMDVPKDDRLIELLSVYGITDYRSFYHRVRNYTEHRTPLDEIRELIEQMNPDRISIQSYAHAAFEISTSLGEVSVKLVQWLEVSDKTG